MHRVRRREFLSVSTATAVSTLLAGNVAARNGGVKFELSLVESSVSRLLQHNSLDHLDFVSFSKNEFGIEAVEYVSSFFPKRAPPDENYVKEMNKRAAEQGVRQLLIALDEDVRVGHPTADRREVALQVVRRWIDVAKSLGCHSVQVNPTSSGHADEQQARAVESLTELCAYADSRKINVLLGNYGGPSADAAWIETVVKAVDSFCCRVRPRIRELRSDDDYRELAKLAPLAKGMRADTLKFDARGNEATTDYRRAVRTLHKAGYRGYVGINYCGEDADEHAGILASRKLLERIRNETN
jgi:sugar phosphate isomerase/epimerase